MTPRFPEGSDVISQADTNDTKPKTLGQSIMANGLDKSAWEISACFGRLL